MTTYAPESVKSLSGRELDRAVEVIVFYSGRIATFKPENHPRRFHSDGNLLDLAFEPGMPLAYRLPAEDAHGELTGVLQVGENDWRVFRYGALTMNDRDVATGSNIREAVWRASCVLKLGGE